MKNTFGKIYRQDSILFFQLLSVLFFLIIFKHKGHLVWKERGLG